MNLIHNWDHKVLSEYLLSVFEKEKDDLLLQAAADVTSRWNLVFVLDHPHTIDFGGTVNYNKRQRRFDFITYCGRFKYAMVFSITSNCYYSAWEHRDWLYRNVPEYYCKSNKKLTEYLLAH